MEFCNRKHFLILIILIYINTEYFFVKSIKLENSIQNLSNIKEGIQSSEELPKDTKGIPILNVKVEEPDRETSTLKLYNGERKMERDRLRDLEARLVAQRRRFSQVIIMQNLQIAALNNIAQANLKMLNHINKTT